MKAIPVKSCQATYTGPLLTVTIVSDDPDHTLDGVEQLSFALVTAIRCRKAYTDLLTLLRKDEEQ